MMRQNAVIGQSGGPTAAINASLAGVYRAAKAGGAAHVYGMRYGLEGLLQDQLVDLDACFAQPDALELLRRTPASFLGSCRYKLPNLVQAREAYVSLFDTLDRHDIGALYYIGGNDSMDSVAKLSLYGAQAGSPVRIVGVPKTIDNDLCRTDHTPGYGSAAKYIACSMSEILCDAGVYNLPSVTIVEIMGRNAGWLAGAACLARTEGCPGPDLILLPEVPFDEDAFVARVRRLLSEKLSVVVAVSEGIRDLGGRLVCEHSAIGGGQRDAFGHRAFLSGTGWYLSALLNGRIGCKTRAVELSTLQRCASHIASLTDINEAEAAGAVAVKAAAKGLSGVMTAFLRSDSPLRPDIPYHCDIVTVPVDEVADLEKKVPREWIAADGMQVTDSFARYARPLIQGELPVLYAGGVPRHLCLA